LCLAPQPLRAHASLVASEPAAGAVLDEPPARLLLVFDEPVQLLALSLLDQGGSARDLASLAANPGERVAADLGEALPAGGYLLSWRAASLDGHVIAGTVAFSVGDATQPGPSQSAANWRWPAYAFRLAARLAVLLAAGAALFVLVVAQPAPPAPLDRWARGAARVALPVVLLAFGAMGAERAGIWPLGLDAGASWSAALAAPAAWTWIVSLAALLVLATLRQGALRLLAALAAPCLLAGSGHALVAWPIAGQALLWLHGIAAAAWIGALWPLRWALMHEPHRAPRLFQRFQGLGLAAVLAVVASGLALALAILPSLATLWSSDYGQRLAAKLLLVAAMLAIAANNRLRTTGAALGPSGTAAARARLRRLLGLDSVVALGVVALAAGLSLDPPPAPVLTLKVEMTHARGSVALTLRPGRVGDNAAELDLRDPDGGSFEPAEVTLRLAAPEAGVAPVTLEARPLGGGRWEVERLPLWVPGPWEIEIALLIDSYTLVKARGSFGLSP